MNAYQAQRLRFGILAARHTLARDRMTRDQVDYLEECELAGWRVQDAFKAFDRETVNIRHRLAEERTRAALTAHGRQATELRNRWMKVR